MKSLYFGLLGILLTLHLQGQTNLGFEQWTDDYPDHWDWFFLGNERFNLNDALLGSNASLSDIPITEVDDAVEGDKAVRLTSVEITGSEDPDVADGIYAGFIGQLFPVNERISQVKFKYRSSVPEQDTAVVVIIIFNDEGEFNLEDDNIIGGGEFTMMGTDEDWTEATIDLEYYNNDIPVTAKIMAASSKDLINAGIFTGNISVGSSIDLDDIILYYGEPTAASDAESPHINLYPNPTDNYLNITLAARGQISIYSMDGNLRMQDILREGQNKIEVGNLANGLYFYTIHTADKKHIQSDKFIIHR